MNEAQEIVNNFYKLKRDFETYRLNKIKAISKPSRTDPNPVIKSLREKQLAYKQLSFKCIFCNKPSHLGTKFSINGIPPSDSNIPLSDSDISSSDSNINDIVASANARIYTIACGSSKPCNNKIHFRIIQDNINLHDRNNQPSTNNLTQLSSLFKDHAKYTRLKVQYINQIIRLKNTTLFDMMPNSPNDVNQVLLNYASTCNTMEYISASSQLIKNEIKDYITPKYTSFNNKVEEIKTHMQDGNIDYVNDANHVIENAVKIYTGVQENETGVWSGGLLEIIKDIRQAKYGNKLSVDYDEDLDTYKLYYESPILIKSQLNSVAENNELFAKYVTIYQMDDLYNGLGEDGNEDEDEDDNGSVDIDIEFGSISSSLSVDSDEPIFSEDKVMPDPNEIVYLSGLNGRDQLIKALYARKYISLNEMKAYTKTPLTCSFEFNENVDFINVTNLTDFSKLFMNFTQFNQNLKHWDVSNGTDFSQMFSGAKMFNNPFNNGSVLNITKWNVSNGTNFNNMFDSAERFVQDISEWRLNVNATAVNMFKSCPLLKYQLFMPKLYLVGQNGRKQLIDGLIRRGFLDPPDNDDDIYYASYAPFMQFNMHLLFVDVTELNDFSDMFRFCEEFNKPLISWKVNNGKNFDRMFAYADKFNQNLYSWEIDPEATTTDMFEGCDNMKASAYPRSMQQK